MRIVPQECQSGLEFTEGFRIHHRLTSSTAAQLDEKPGASRSQEIGFWGGSEDPPRRVRASRQLRQVNHQNEMSRAARR